MAEPFGAKGLIRKYAANNGDAIQKVSRRFRREFSQGPLAKPLEPFPGGRCSRYWGRAPNGSPMDRQTKKELWVLAISATAVPLVAGVAAFLLR
jgi:hypothetical protein